MILTDTHCHLYLENFQDDIDEVLSRASADGVSRILMPAINWSSLEAMDRLLERAVSGPGSNITLYKMVGIHPCDIQDNKLPDEEKLHQLASSDEFVAVGETGLDYYWSRDFVIEQKRSLEIHCSVARETGKPIVLHNRESTDDLLDIIEAEQDGTLKGVWHCFNGTVNEGKRAIGLGLCLGIGGVLTFKNAGVDKTVRELPLESMILETDAPYLSPEPHRGARNEPARVRLVAEKLAAIHSRPLQEVADVTNRNTDELFGL